MPTDFVQHLMQQPVWVQVWVAWVGLVNLATVACLKRKEARIVLGVFLANMVSMNALFALNGFNRLLGLSHVIWWTPLVIYLARQLPCVDRATGFGLWLRAVLATNAACLVIDYLDVVRYLLGDRS